MFFLNKYSAVAELAVTTSSTFDSILSLANFSLTFSLVVHGLLVTKRIILFIWRNFFNASGAPVRACSPTYTTPSKSNKKASNDCAIIFNSPSSIQQKKTAALAIFFFFKFSWDKKFYMLL